VFCVRAEQRKIPNFDSIHAHTLRHLCNGDYVSFVLFIRPPNVFFMYLFSDSHSVRCPTTFHVVLTVDQCFCRCSGVHVDSVSITTFISFATCLHMFICLWVCTPSPTVVHRKGIVLYDIKKQSRYRPGVAQRVPRS
jgi:hypothetical protein